MTGKTMRSILKKKPMIKNKTYLLAEIVKKILYLFYYFLGAVLIFYLIRSMVDDGFIFTLCGLMDSSKGSWCD